MITKNNKRALGFLVTNAAIFALAANANAIPTSADPGQVQKRFEPAISSPEVSQPAAPQQSLPNARQQPDPFSGKRIALQNVVIDGNTVFSDEKLKSTYTGLIGKQISGKEARQIAKRITEFYRNNDYIMAQATVPVQSAAGGTLKIKVVEGAITSVSFVGDIKGRKELLEAYGANITNARPLTGAALERNMLLMEDLPGATAKALIRPSATQPGTADLVVTVGHKDYDLSYSADNRGSKPIGTFQHYVTASANSLFGLYDRTTARAITTSPTTELRFFDLQHEEQLGTKGTKIIGTVSHSRTDPGDNLRSSNVIGTSDFAQLNVTHPFIRSRSENLSGRAIFDARNTDTDLSGANFTEDRLRVVRVGGNYNFIDPWMGATLIDSEISQGLNIFNATSSGANRTRTNGDSDFTKINLDLSRTQNISGPWSFFTSASGQYASGPLLAAEQFLLGGTGYGRAYDPSELTGDNGLAGKAELRYSAASGYDYLSSYQLYSFYDIGKVWLRGSNPGVFDEKSLSSLGAGVRLYFSPMLYGNVEAAVPLTKDATNQGGHGDDARLFFSITARY